jgi:hypothetical protein
VMTVEGHYRHKVVVWKANVAMPLCALISPISCSDDTSLEMCQVPKAREEAVDDHFVAPEQLKVLVAAHHRLVHDRPRCHGTGKWVKTRRPGRTRPRPCNLGCPGIHENRQVMGVVPCLFDLL